MKRPPLAARALAALLSLSLSPLPATARGMAAGFVPAGRVGPAALPGRAAPLPQVPGLPALNGFGLPAYAPALPTDAATIPCPALAASPLAPDSAPRPAAEPASRAALAPEPGAPAPAPAAAPEPLSAAPAAQALEEAGQKLSEAQASGSEPKAQAALDALFDEETRGNAALEAAAAAAAAPSGAAPASPRTVTGPRGSTWSWGAEPPAPRSSLARSARVGLIWAVIPLVLTNAAIFVAQALGYDLNPNYSSPMADGGVTLLQSLIFMLVAGVIAPIAEEPLFRFVPMGALGWFTRALPKTAAFWAAALPTSALFVLVHETQDPLLMAVRMMGALMLARVYHKEGMAASMFAHGFFNALLTVPIVLMAAFGKDGGSIAWLATLPVLAFAMWRASKRLKAEKADVESGAVVPYQITPKGAVWMAVALFAAFFFLMPNPYWLAGAGSLLIYSWLKGRR